ncbi:MAG: Ig-like domain-containing protein [Kofleriaceae bacterium]|nr:Ig-like domain-containing protein [Kofleriaceae bacterium]
MRMLSCLAVVLATTGSAAADEHLTPMVRGPHSCGTRQVAPVVSHVQDYQLAPGAQRVVYLNKNGGTYMVGPVQTNALTNAVNTIVSYGGSSRSAVIPPLPTGFNWPEIVTCVKDYYKAFDIRFVETEPTEGPFIEAVVGGDGSEVGYPAGAGLLGIAAADNFCGVTETGVAFNFAEAHGGSSRNRELCATIAHEVGHLLALEHETLATDIMSYVPVTQAASKSFVDQFSACGTYPNQPQQCTCTSSQQNSYQRLTSYVGTRPADSVSPTLGIESPSDGGNVPPTFEVVARATDNMGMADVRVLIDGAEVAVSSMTSDGERYKITVRNVGLGQRMLTVIARDLAGNEAKQEKMLTIAKLETGASCIDNAACAGNICAGSEDGNFCTQACDLNNDSCPEDFDCATAGNASVCVVADGGCGCQTNDPRGALTVGLVLGLGALIGRRRRR